MLGVVAGRSLYHLIKILLYYLYHPVILLAFLRSAAGVTGEGEVLLAKLTLYSLLGPKQIAQNMNLHIRLSEVIAQNTTLPIHL